LRASKVTITSPPDGFDTEALDGLGLCPDCSAMEKQLEQPDFMALALSEAQKAGDRGEVPVGAVLVDPTVQAVVASAGNQVEADHDPTAHAEMLVIRTAAAAHSDARLAGCDLYVTLEPCPMCATAISFARLRRVEFGAYDPKGGGVDHGPKIFSQPTCHHQPEVIGGVRELEAAEMLKSFFAERR
jgi:tRNA(adenine34) deaminase